MSSSSSFSASPRHCVLVVGDMGVGKSFFIKSHLPADAVGPDSDVGGDRITPRSSYYQSKEPNIFLYDTPGLNLNGCENGVPRSQVAGSRVHIVVIINNRRWNTVFTQVRERLKNVYKISLESITPWLSFDSTCTGAGCPKKITELNVLKRDLYSFSLVPDDESVPMLPSSDPKPKASSSSSSSSKIKKPVLTSCEVVFGQPKPSLPPIHLRLFNGLKALGIALPQQKKMSAEHWKMIVDVCDVTKYKNVGESFLEGFFWIMHSSDEYAKNEHLMYHVNQLELKPHIDDKIYLTRNMTQQQRDAMTDEPYGNYMEALFGLLLFGVTEKPKLKLRPFVIDFLLTISQPMPPKPAAEAPLHH